MKKASVYRMVDLVTRILLFSSAGTLSTSILTLFLFRSSADVVWLTIGLMSLSLGFASLTYSMLDIGVFFPAFTVGYISATIAIYLVVGTGNTLSLTAMVSGLVLSVFSLIKIIGDIMILTIRSGLSRDGEE